MGKEINSKLRIFCLKIDGQILPQVGFFSTLIIFRHRHFGSYKRKHCLIQSHCVSSRVHYHNASGKMQNLLIEAAWLQVEFCSGSYQIFLWGTVTFSLVLMITFLRHLASHTFPSGGRWYIDIVLWTVGFCVVAPDFLGWIQSLLIMQQLVSAAALRRKSHCPCSHLHYWASKRVMAINY